MNIVDPIKDYLKQKEQTKAPEGLCPNCWGHTEYEGMFREALENEKVDLNNIDDKKGWIQAYAAKYFEGIKLKYTDDLYECPNCKLTYRP